MSRDEGVSYKQDRLGNERKELDELRAQDGAYGSDSDDQGIQEITSSDTDSDLTVYSIPSNVDAVHLTQIQAFNSVGSGDNTVQILELDLDGSGNINSSTRRSVPINVSSGSTNFHDYEGLEFNKAIGINSEFEGQVAVSVRVDRKEYVEPNSENY